MPPKRAGSKRAAAPKRGAARASERALTDAGGAVADVLADDVLAAPDHAVATRAEELEAPPPRGRRARRTQHDAVQLLPLPCGPCWRSRMIQSQPICPR